MLFKISQKPIREDNDSIDAIKEFSVLSDREMKYICLVYDYETPFKQYGINDRKELACEAAGYKRESPKRLDKSARAIMNGKIENVEIAIPVYKSLIRDLDRELLISYDLQVEQFIEKASQPKSSDSDYKLAAMLNEKLIKMLALRDQIKEKLSLRAGFEEDEKDDVEDVPLSTLDKINEAKINAGN